MKLTQRQMSVLQQIAERNGSFTAWSLGTATCEALRKRGLVSHHGGERPFTTGWRDNEYVNITDAGRTALSEAEEK